jgi:NADH:ubiquinone reductase (non-electrogenic)
MDCCETATFKDQSPEERKRLLHMVVVGGGPTGVEFAGELQDFFENDLKTWMPEIADEFRVTLVEALPSVSYPILDWFLEGLLTSSTGSPHVLQELD